MMEVYTVGTLNVYIILNQIGPNYKETNIYCITIPQTEFKIKSDSGDF